MPSNALRIWEADRAAELDEIEQAHAAVGGSERGRRYTTQQINHAYAMLLSSQFQGFCRDLHTECVDLLVGSVHPFGLRPVVNVSLHQGRKLDRGNPNPGHIGSDFGRLVRPGPKFWDLVEAADGRYVRRRRHLEELCAWRNAIAHQDFSEVGNAFLRKATVQQWRRSCNGLAKTFDRVMRDALQSLTQRVPW